MTIQEIYELFESIGCCTFATVNNDYPETRIAHFRAYDNDGIYFMTMTTKPFYKQLKQSSKVSVCGLGSDSKVKNNEDGTISFDIGYFIRLTGDVKEVTIDEIKRKNNPIFDFCIEDYNRYPTMTVFVIYRAKCEIFDFDFDKIKRNNKLERKRFSFGDFKYENAGFFINDTCIKCGKCMKVCSFDAIYKDGDYYKINGSRCDECGMCCINCPVGAIDHKGK